MFLLITRKNKEHRPALPATIRARWRSIVLGAAAAIFVKLKLPFKSGESICLFDVELDMKRKAINVKIYNPFQSKTIILFLHFLLYFYSLYIITDILNSIVFIQYILKKVKKKSWKERLKKENESTSVTVIITSHLVAGIRCVMIEEQKKCEKKSSLNVSD